MLSRVSPVSAFTGQDISLQIYGSGFSSDTVVYLGSTPGEMEYVSPTQVQATFFHIPGPETAQITAVNGNSSVSNAVTLSIANSYISGISLQPTSLQAGSGSFSLEVMQLWVRLHSSRRRALCNGMERRCGNLLERGDSLAQVPASDVANTGTATVTVVTPQALYGQGTSNAVTFTIAPQAPLLQVRTKSLTIGPVLSGNSATGTITIQSAGQSPMTVSVANVPSSANQFTVTIIAQGMWLPK